MITIQTKPNKYSAAYSYLPLRVSSSDINGISYQYLISIIYDTVNYSFGGIPVSVNGQIGLSITLDNVHKFKVGDKIILNGLVRYAGLYDIISIPTTTSVVINLETNAPIINTGYIGKVIPYRMDPNLTGTAELDLSGTLKDFVTSNFIDTNKIISGANTRFKYNLAIGERKQLSFPFTDNYYMGAGAGVGFIKPGVLVADVQFKVGDTINIQQENAAWEFQQESDNAGKVKLTSTDNHDFKVGASVTVVDVYGYPYNGPTKVLDVTSTSMTIDKDYGGSNTSYTGYVFGQPRPNYNVTTTITSIAQSGADVLIGTDIPREGNTVPIPGIITLSYQKYFTNYFINAQFPGYADQFVYNARIEDQIYKIDGFDKYVIQDRSAELNNLSTILKAGNRYRIEYSSKSFILLHTDIEAFDSYGLEYKFYSAAGALLATTNSTKISSSTMQDIYCPIGIDDLINSPDHIGPTLSSIKHLIDHYTVQGKIVKGASTILTVPINFEINKDCSKYELMELIWKDGKGSWLSYPFKYIHRESIELDKSTYYKKQGRFTDDGEFTLDNLNSGEQTYYARSREKVELNSGWIKDYENELIKDLLKSSTVMIKIKDQLMAVQIENNKFDFASELNEQIYNYKINIRYTTNDYR